MPSFQGKRRSPEGRPGKRPFAVLLKGAKFGACEAGTAQEEEPARSLSTSRRWGPATLLQLKPPPDLGI